MTIKHNKTSTAGASSDPAKVGGDDWNADHVVDSGGIAMAIASATPATPPAGTMQLYAAESLAAPLGILTPDGQLQLMQSSFTRRSIRMMVAVSATTSFNFLGLNYSGGVAQARTPATSGTNVLALANRLGIAGAASTAGTTSYMIMTQGGQVCRGTGFRLNMRAGAAETNTVARSFYGLTFSLFQNTNPSSQPNVIGFGTDSGDTSLSLIYNDAAGSATKVALGANFPDHTNADMYDITLYAVAGASKVSVEIVRVGTQYVYRADLTTDLPAATVALYPILTRSNATATVTPAFDVGHVYLDTEI